MKVIMELVEKIDDELKGAKEYAESYVDYKSRGNNKMADRFKEMANDELKHATYIHELAVNEIDRLETVFVAPEYMRESWKKSHIRYAEQTAWIRQMLNM